ncbi:MAG: rod shape-determining protein MreC [Sporocytophaga sp.]|uniref:rod shape-determining protein MreC n=1 Tax=Sporocytophaga sp. TaxID=2231183 RepID=UPI001B0EC325|nr:rod shape-determining protein MreC [Sporocytophaga sp.]MBO9702290.1 rod shape-determining protein MreC [Sporocytophaga sp.]
MHRLFHFLYQYKAFLFFLILEAICVWLIIRNNSYQSASYFNTSNYVVGEILETSNNVTEYFNLKDVNTQLAGENARLKRLLTKEYQKKDFIISNKSEFLKANQYNYIPAKVVNNSTSRFTNYITIDKGSLDGIKPGMGVIAQDGIVGKVKSCTENFSTIISLLHEKWSVSAKISDGEIDGIVKWQGMDPAIADLQYVGRHHHFKIGDSVVTSGYNTLFPPGALIGRIQDFKIDQGKPFYKINVKLATDFTTLKYVYVIENYLKAEKDSLENQSNYSSDE